MNVFLCVFVYLSVSVCMSRCVSMSVDGYVSVCMSGYVSMSVCLCLYFHVFVWCFHVYVCRCLHDVSRAWVYVCMSLGSRGSG